ncbi:MAG: prepilin-type N-terminal cleavage/methylation domain-containing protein [Planctomycetota bacterium]
MVIGSGFTLLEVILALAVLAVSLAVIGEANSGADRNARRAALESDATLVAESIVAQLSAGLVELVAVDAVPWDDGATTPTWSYAIAVEPTAYDGLLRARVTVSELQPVDRTAVQVSLSRWFEDPAFASTSAETTDSQGGGL